MVWHDGRGASTGIFRRNRSDRAAGAAYHSAGRAAQIAPALLCADAARRQASALARCSLAGGHLGWALLHSLTLVGAKL
jgi:hypothetical protein